MSSSTSDRVKLLHGCGNRIKDLTGKNDNIYKIRCSRISSSRHKYVPNTFTDDCTQIVLVLVVLSTHRQQRSQTAVEVEGRQLGEQWTHVQGEVVTLGQQLTP